MNFKFKLYKNKLKKSLISQWYRLMKPLATILCKIEDNKRKTEEDKLNKIVNTITDNNAIERLLDVMLKDFAKYPDTEWTIFIAEHDSWDDSIETIKYYMIRQECDKYLRAWAHKLPYCSFDINKSLTYKFKDKVLSHGAFDVKSVTHCVYGQKYENTLVITLNDQYLSLFRR